VSAWTQEWQESYDIINVPPVRQGLTNRVASLPASASQYTSAYGVGDPATNAFYRVVVYSDTWGAMRTSEALGEFDTDTATGPPGQAEIHDRARRGLHGGARNERSPGSSR
jgi:hypothetical protein